jgi:hypothetical protein
MRGVLTPAIELWNFESHEGLPSPHFESVSLILTFSQSRIATIEYMFLWIIFLNKMVLMKFIALEGLHMDMYNLFRFTTILNLIWDF